MDPSCDACGKRVDERSMAIVEDTSQPLFNHYFVCQACHGYYSEEELIEKLTESSKPTTAAARFPNQ